MADKDYTSVFMTCAQRLEGANLKINVNPATGCGGLTVDRKFLNERVVPKHCLEVANTYLSEELIENIE